MNKSFRKLLPILNCRQTYFKQNHTLNQKLEENVVIPGHKPVMVKEVVDNLDLKPNGTYIDMTFGAGGHSLKLLEKQPDIKIIALDRDPDAHQNAVQLSEKHPQIIPILGRFSEVPTHLKQMNISHSSIDGIFFDYGCSSMQFDTPERGFSIIRNGPLDMRMDKNRFPDQPTAAEVLAKIDEPDLARIIKVYGEEKLAKKIARAIIDVRYSLRKLETTGELVDLIGSCFSDEYKLDRSKRTASNVATKTFQAIRIFINNELNEINHGMLIAGHYLKIGGRLITITFHSLEDTIVKRHLHGNIIGTLANPLPLKYSSHSFVSESDTMRSIMSSKWSQCHKHVLVPTEAEIEANHRSRSARLRAAYRIK